MKSYEQKTSKMLPKGEVSPFMTPKILLQKSGSFTFVTLWYPNFIQNIRKTNEQSLIYLKTDRQTDHGQTDYG